MDSHWLTLYKKSTKRASLTMPSMDIVSEVNASEILNATNNSNREISSRFDFRGVDAAFDYTKEHVTARAEAEFQCQQLLDIFRAQLMKRKIDPRAMLFNEKALHRGKIFSIPIAFKQGIPKEVCKKIVKLIKDSKLKVQCQTQGDQVRVSGKKRDDLQKIMSIIKEAELEQPFQFKNFKD